jgi:hypothetical protein
VVFLVVAPCRHLVVNSQPHFATTCKTTALTYIAVKTSNTLQTSADECFIQVIVNVGSGFKCYTFSQKREYRNGRHGFRTPIMNSPLRNATEMDYCRVYTTLKRETKMIRRNVSKLSPAMG